MVKQKKIADKLTVNELKKLLKKDLKIDEAEELIDTLYALSFIIYDLKFKV